MPSSRTQTHGTTTERPRDAASIAPTLSTPYSEPLSARPIFSTWQFEWPSVFVAEWPIARRYQKQPGRGRASEWRKAILRESASFLRSRPGGEGTERACWQLQHGGGGLLLVGVTSYLISPANAPDPREPRNKLSAADTPPAGVGERCTASVPKKTATPSPAAASPFPFVKCRANVVRH